MTRHILLACAFVATVAAAWLWAHEGHHALPTRGVQVDSVKGLVNLAAPTRAALRVETAVVTRQPVEETILAPATVVPPWDRHAFATTRLGGKILAVHVQPGQEVKQGQVLAEIESLELETLQLDLLAAHNSAQLTGKLLAQIERLFAEGSAADRDVQDARTRHRQNEHAVEIARRKLLGLGVEADFLSRLLADPAGIPPLRSLAVKSPIAGAVVHVDAPLGQVVEPTTHLFELVDLTRVWVHVGVLEKDLHRVEIGVPVRLRLAALSGPTETLEATVRLKGLYLDPVTHLGTVWVDLDNSGERLLPGMFGHAHVGLPDSKDGVTVPARAVIRDGAERYVLVEEGPGQYQRRYVVVEREAGGLARLAKHRELFVGDRVVTAGSHQIAPFFGQDVLRLTPEGERNSGLRLARAERRPVDEVIRLRAAVDLPPDRRAVVSARLAGTVQRIAIGREQKVKVGDLVAEVASLELHDLQLEALRAHLQLELLQQILP
ncbi:MAG: efflux RND transporter periplasmic adaptor subunit, partial [Gemmataceae bacterium]|nr:efflux RND transporter periplasmic adaptor subunit [Gemmataceae bacterium]